MSSGFFLPKLSGQSWSTIRTPVWATKIQTAVSGRELRAAYMANCRYKYTLTYEVLNQQTANDLQNLMAFYNNMQGSWNDFFYQDPYDYVATAMGFGTGDGITTAFTLYRTIGGTAGGFSGGVAFDPVLLNTGQAYQFFVNGSPVTPSVSNGVGNLATITFASPPALGAALTWTGQYMYRCRFMDDSIDLENFMQNLWQLNKLEFITIK